MSNESKPAVATLKGLIQRIDVMDRYVYRRGEKRRKQGPRASITIAFEPKVLPARGEHEDDEVLEVEPYEFDVPRELASELRIGMEIEIDIRPKW